MNPTIKLILIIFAVFFGISVLVAVIMTKLTKEGKMGAIEKKLSDAMGITPHDFSAARYGRESPCQNHTESSAVDEEFGRAVEVILSRKLRNLIMGTVWIALGIVFLFSRDLILTDSSQAVPICWAVP